MSRSGTLLVASLLLFVPVAGRADEISVLYIGNSYTAENDLPRVVFELAKSKGHWIVSDAAVSGGFNFATHAQSKDTRVRIAERKWDFVVLQDQSEEPSFPPSQVAEEVTPFALELNKLIHANNASTRILFFETWGHKDGDRPHNCKEVPEICTYEGMQKRLIETYTDLARQTSGILAPVGTVWREMRRDHPEVELYAADGNHPSIQGTYLAACVLFSTLFQAPSSGAPPLSLAPAQAALIQSTADRFLAQNRAAPPN